MNIFIYLYIHEDDRIETIQLQTKPQEWVIIYIQPTNPFLRAARCRSPHPWLVRGSPHQIPNWSNQVISSCADAGLFCPVIQRLPAKQAACDLCGLHGSAMQRLPLETWSAIVLLKTWRCGRDAHVQIYISICVYLCLHLYYYIWNDIYCICSHSWQLF